MAASAGPYNVAARKLATASPGDDEAVVDAVKACANNTLAAASARIEVRFDTEFTRLDKRERGRPGPLGRLTRFAAATAWKRIAPGVDAADLREAFMHQLGEGFIEPTARRYMIDSGAYAEMFVNGTRFGGQSGQPLRPRKRYRGVEDEPGDPLTLLRIMREATGARNTSEETVRDVLCRMVTVRAGSSEFMVWIDDEYIRRIQSEDRASKKHSTVSRRRRFELWDFGVSLDSLDWSRLPKFRLYASPGDARGQGNAQRSQPLRRARLVFMRPPPRVVRRPVLTWRWLAGFGEFWLVQYRVKSQRRTARSTRSTAARAAASQSGPPLPSAS